MKTDLFQSCGHCWVFQICWHSECGTYTASSLRIWNSSAGIPSPPLALFIVKLPEAHLTSYSRVSGSRWVTTPPWLSGSLRTFLYSSLYSCLSHVPVFISLFLEIKKRWQEYTEQLYKKTLNDPDNHDDVVTHLEPDILECEVKWTLISITINKASGGVGIPAELLQILKDDAVKVLHSICQQIWKTQQ